MSKKKIERLIFARVGNLITCESCGATGPEIRPDFPLQFAFDCPSCGKRTKYQINPEDK